MTGGVERVQLVVYFKDTKAHQRADRQHCGPQFWSLSQGGLVSAGWSNIPHRCHGRIPDTSPGWAGRGVTLIISPSLSGPRLGSPVSRATDSFGGSAAHPRTVPPEAHTNGSQRCQLFPIIPQPEHWLRLNCSGSERRLLELSPAVNQATATAPDTPPPLRQQVTGLLGERDGKKMIGLKHKMRV
ncbi:unnamed protein product [Boreogadus saida]